MAAGDLPHNANNVRTIGTVVRPQKVSADKTVAQSVVDFFNDVLPQLGNSPQAHKANDKEAVLWIRMEQSDHYGDGGSEGAVYVLLGYANGAQIWAIEPHGEAWEVYSSRQGPVKHLRLLPFPEEVLGTGDAFGDKRPLLACCDLSASSQPFSSINIISLLSGDKVHSIKFRAAIENIMCNQRVMVVVFPDRCVVYDACTFKERFFVNASFPVHLVSPNPLALGTRWLAYSEMKLHDVYQSLGGRVKDGVPSYTASVISAAKTISQGISQISEAVAHSITALKRPVPHSPSSTTVNAEEGVHEGIVTVLDLDKAGDGQFSLEKGSVSRSAIIGHFVAHSSSPVAVLAFNHDGTLLLSGSQSGQHFHLFLLQPHPAGSSLASVQHLYTLHRGDTNATVQDIAFSLDSRWVALTTLRATTHVFPITPYGGPISYRTHSACRVVNKTSRFVKSAGLDEADFEVNASKAGYVTSVGGVAGSSSSPAGLAAVPTGSSPRLIDATRVHTVHSSHPSTTSQTGSIATSPCQGRTLEAQKVPLVIQPLSQIRNSPSLKVAQAAVLASTCSSANRGSSSSCNSTASAELVRVAACFVTRRFRTNGEVPACDAMLIGTSHGALVEYSLQPVVASQVERIAQDVPVALNIHAQAQWSLNRHLNQAEFLPPFSASHPLVQSRAFCGGNKAEKGPEDNNRAGYHQRILNVQSSSDVPGLDEAWLSQVEIVTHAGPSRRLWMGPQFRFVPSLMPGCAAAQLFPTNSLHAATEIQRTGSDWDLTNGTNLQLTNLRLQSQPLNVLLSSDPHAVISIDAGSGSFDRAVFPDYLSKKYGSNEELRMQEIADAMTDLPCPPPPLPLSLFPPHFSSDIDAGRDIAASGLPLNEATLPLRGSDFDESPEDLSVSSIDSNGHSPSTSSKHLTST